VPLFTQNNNNNALVQAKQATPSAVVYNGWKVRDQYTESWKYTVGWLLWCYDWVYTFRMV